ncbi:GFA family protein [Haliangium ochraceum]|uniref:Glutathione-dependent formaldehyde-activating GFA n=1 Tax=Haliangium ochraceum (strain DSM 14365 / JCM 11303 / SMP-2) TaxID=502025 RepID=D0LWX9_HALO1|nr:GFA family protein [Haliangium ochraceum]ACY14226.1 glutathione-dependent formaldehyde-activating GFA [Haliangium ochraceum DSM 14365]
MANTYSGSCLCGQVSYEVAGDFEHFILCHCRHCQKDTGSAHAANLFSSTAALTWLSGHERVTDYRLPHSRHAKSFCSACGSAVPSLQQDGALLVVPAGSLDTPLERRPDAHIFTASRAAWSESLTDLPAFAELPPQAD